jgi:hypothetical protein
MSTRIVVRQAGIGQLGAVAAAFAAASADEAVSTWVMEGHSDIAERYRKEYVPSFLERALTSDEVWIAGVAGGRPHPDSHVVPGLRGEPDPREA